MARLLLLSLVANLAREVEACQITTTILIFMLATETFVHGMVPRQLISIMIVKTVDIMTDMGETLIELAMRVRTMLVAREAMTETTIEITIEDRIENVRPQLTAAVLAVVGRPMMFVVLRAAKIPGTTTGNVAAVIVGKKVEGKNVLRGVQEAEVALPAFRNEVARRKPVASCAGRFCKLLMGVS